jgi:single-strand DNA-binding protein
MARGVNKVILVGNIGNDPDIKQAKSGNGQIVNLSIATSSSQKDRDGNRNDVTEWHNIVFLGKLGDIAAQYLQKGMQIYVEGSLKTEKWQTQDGIDQQRTKIIANQMQMLGSKSDNQGGGGQRNGGSNNNRRQNNNNQRGGGYQQNNRNNNNNRPQNNNVAPDEEFFDDDIPF